MKSLVYWIAAAGAAISGVATALAADPLSLSPGALREIAKVEAEIDRIEAELLGRIATPPDNQVQQVELLGKLMLFDKELSVNRNEACAFCHMPETGFTGCACSKLQKDQESIEFSTPQSYRHQHAHASVRPRFPALVPGSQPRFAGT